MPYLHIFPFIAVLKVGIGKCSVNKSPEYYATTRTQSTGGKDEAGDVACGFFVAQEYNALASNQGIKKYDYRMCLRSVCVQVRVLRTGD